MQLSVDETVTSGNFLPSGSAFSCNLPTRFCAKLRNYGAVRMASELQGSGYLNQLPGDCSSKK
jgi:hypothetical protein